MFLCTSKPTVFATRIVRHFGFDAHLHGIYGADLDGALDDKGKLLAQLLAIERIDSGTATMIGDRVNDISAAHVNGARAVGVLWGYGTRQELADAEALVATPAELVTLLLAPLG
jgi:phosphoglycolate phosphatase